jgi:predicted dehydrogenase
MIPRIGVIGLEQQTRDDYLAALVQSGLCQLVAICDADASNVKQLSYTYNVQALAHLKTCLPLFPLIWFF